MVPTLIPTPWHGGRGLGGETGQEDTKGTLKQGSDLQLVGNRFFGNTEN